MADTPITVHPLSASWLALGGRCAAAGGALCALLSLWFDAPVWVASLRGAALWLALRWLVRLTASAALATLDSDEEASPKSTK
jgi:hypothetical protein